MKLGSQTRLLFDDSGLKKMHDLGVTNHTIGFTPTYDVDRDTEVRPQITHCEVSKNVRMRF